MKGRLQFKTEGDASAAALAGMAALREQLNRAEVHWIENEPLLLHYRRGWIRRRTGSGIHSPVRLQCTVEPDGFSLEFDALLPRGYLLLPVIWIIAMTIYVLVEREIGFALFLLAGTIGFFLLWRFFERDYIGFLQSTIIASDEHGRVRPAFFEKVPSAQA